MPATLLRPATWTLRSQVLASVLALFVIVMVTTGALTIGFTKHHLDDRLRDELNGPPAPPTRARRAPVIWA